MIALFVGAAIITGLGLERINDDTVLRQGRERNHIREVAAVELAAILRAAEFAEPHDIVAASRSTPASASPRPAIGRSVVNDPPVLVEVTPAPVQRTLTVALTIYVCQNAPPGQSYCGTMASGKRVYAGAAACGYSLDLGDRFRIAGDPTWRSYICEDRGAGPYHWIDIFFWDYYAGQAWRKQYGETVEIEIEG